MSRGLLVTARQLEVLQAAAAGHVHRDSPDRWATWRVDGGRACSLSAWCLIDRDLMRPATTPDEHGRIKALVTTEGYAILAELASREPGPAAPEITG